MGMVGTLSLILLLAAAQTLGVYSSPTTTPAFLFSSHHLGSLNEPKEVVNYQTLSLKDLAKAVFSEGGWSKLLCSRDIARQQLDFALIFIGSKFQPLYNSKKPYLDQDLMDLLEMSFRGSNFSMAFPYVSLQTESSSVEKLLVSEITESCGEHSQLHDIAVTDSCLTATDNFKKLTGPSALLEYVDLKMQTKQKGETSLIVICPKSLQGLKGLSEGKMMSEIIKFLEKFDASYSVLYASDPSRSLKYPSHQLVERFLTDGNSIGNDSSIGCDGVCQIKSTLLEGVLVGIVLLIILLSGICCMLGIDTPTRFEVSQDT